MHEEPTRTSREGCPSSPHNLISSTTFPIFYVIGMENRRIIIGNVVEAGLCQGIDHEGMAACMLITMQASLHTCLALCDICDISTHAVVTQTVGAARFVTPQHVCNCARSITPPLPWPSTANTCHQSRSSVDRTILNVSSPGCARDHGLLKARHVPLHTMALATRTNTSFAQHVC